MSSRLGPACLAVGVLLIGAAFFMATAANAAQAAALPPPAAFSTGFVVWSACGVLGLLIGVAAVRRVRIAPAHRDVTAWEIDTVAVAVPPTPVVAGLGTAVDAMEGSS